MKRRQFLTVGTAVLAAPALPSVTATADFGVGAFLLAGAELAALTT